MKTYQTHCSTCQKLLMILGTALFTFISVFALADEAPTKHKFQKANRSRYTQKTLRMGVSTSYINSASGHKSGISTNYGIGNSRNFLVAGAILNSETNNMDGMHLRYKRYLIPNSNSSSLYLQTSAIYRYNSPLKNKLNEVMHDEDFTGVAEIYNTMELYAGFGFQKFVGSKMFADLSVGLGGYSRQLASADDNRCCSFIRYSADQGIGVNVKLTVGFYLW